MILGMSNSFLFLAEAEAQPNLRPSGFFASFPSTERQTFLPGTFVFYNF